jgi:hypothetical protein
MLAEELQLPGSVSGDELLQKQPYLGRTCTG